MITDLQAETMSDAEQAAAGKRLAKAIRDLDEMRRMAKDAMNEMKEGIDNQEVEVRRLAELVRTGQKDLFPEPEPPSQIQELKNGVDRAAKDPGLKAAFGKLQKLADRDGATMSVKMGDEEIVIAKPKKKKADGKSAAAKDPDIPF